MAKERRTDRCDCSTSRMISSFSAAGYLTLGRPQHRSCSFKQAVFQGQIGNQLLQSHSLSAQILDLAAAGLASGVSSQPLPASLKVLLRSAVIQALDRRRANSSPDCLPTLLHLPSGTIPRCCPRLEGRTARSGYFPENYAACAQRAGCPSRPALQAPFSSGGSFSSPPPCGVKMSRKPSATQSRQTVP